MILSTTSNAKTKNIVSAGISESILTPAMRDFWSGMHFLHRYAARCHADIETIGRNNLRLLHNTLMADAQYRAIVAEAGRSVSSRGLPISHQLFSTVEISAEIFSLRQGGSLRLATSPNQQGLLMVLSGRAAYKDDQDKPLSFSQKIQGWLTGTNTPSMQVLKTEDVIWEQLTGGAEPHSITATSAVCVALRVRLPLSALSANGESQHKPSTPRIAAVG